MIAETQRQQKATGGEECVEEIGDGHCQSTVVQIEAIVEENDNDSGNSDVQVLRRSGSLKVSVDCTERISCKRRNKLKSVGNRFTSCTQSEFIEDVFVL